MKKKAFLVFILPILLILVYHRYIASSPWPTTSSPIAPQLEGLPRLLVPRDSDISDRLRLLMIDLEQKTELDLERAVSLTPLLADRYDVVDGLLLNDSGQYIDLPDGIVSPNGLWLTTNNESDLHLFRIDGEEMLLSKSGRFPIWSFDSQRLAYLDDDGIWAVEIDSLTPQKVSERDGEPLAWSADNQQLLVRQGNDAVVVNLAAKQEQSLNGVDASEIHLQPVWSADGQTIYARYGDTASNTRIPKSRLVAIEINNGTASMRDLLPNGRRQQITDLLPSPDRSVLLVRQEFCRYEFDGLVPFLPEEMCYIRHLLVESSTGRYVTFPVPSIWSYKAVAWEQQFPPVDLADLPMPVTPSMTSSPSTTLSDDGSFWQPSAPLGHNPATAVPFGQPKVLTEEREEDEHVIFSVVEMISGKEALTLALNAGAPPPFAGYTYIAVRQRIDRKSRQLALHQTPGTRLVDTARIAHKEILWLDDTGQKIAKLDYGADSPADYWQLFAVHEEAQPWFLLFEGAPLNDNLDVYFRLDDNPEWDLLPGVETLPVNTVGVFEPAGMGETAVSNGWQITLLDEEVGDLATLSNNLIKLRIAHTGITSSYTGRLYTCIAERDFTNVGTSRISGNPFFYRQQPLQSFYHEPCFFPGAVYEGWLMVVPDNPEEKAAFRFNLRWDGSDDPFNGRTFAK